MSMIMLGMSPQVFKQFTSHNHDTWEIVLNLVGSGYTIIGGEKYAFRPGTIICQPPNIPHSKFSQEGFKDVFWQPTSFPLAKSVEENCPLIFQDDAGKSFETLLLMAYNSYHEKKNNHRLIVEALIESANQLLIGWLNNVPDEKDVSQLKKALIEAFTDPEFTISQLLGDSPYSSDHMRWRFKKATGQTPGEYLTNLRIEHAKKLMCENRLLRYHISEIGIMSGYYDIHYFSRIFKKKTGMTPTEFIKVKASLYSKDL